MRSCVVLVLKVLSVVQVTRSGLMNACSIAGIMLTTQAVMVEKPRDRAGRAANATSNPGFNASGMPAGLTM